MVVFNVIFGRLAAVLILLYEKNGLCDNYLHIEYLRVFYLMWYSGGR